MNITDIIPTSVETIMACYPNGGSFRFMLDELQNFTINSQQENTNLTGRGGRVIGVLKRNKAVTVSGANGMVSLGLIEAGLGTQGKSGETTVKMPDFIEAFEKDGAVVAETTNVAVGTVGNEIGELFIKNPNGTVKARLTQDATAAEGKFAYDPTTKLISFKTGEVVAGDEITVYYKRKVNADAILENVSDKYSETLELYVDCIGEDKCKNQYRMQYFIPYADTTGNFEITVGDSQTVHNFEATSVASACGNGSSKFYDLIIFGVNTEDNA